MLTEKRYLYVAVKHSLYSDELGKYESYGIKVNADGIDVGFIGDVSTEYDVADKLCALCNENQLSPDHLSEIVEDMLQKSPI